jgi:hypothetical protein
MTAEEIAAWAAQHVAERPVSRKKGQLRPLTAAEIAEWAAKPQEERPKMNRYDEIACSRIGGKISFDIYYEEHAASFRGDERVRKMHFGWARKGHTLVLGRLISVMDDVVDELLESGKGWVSGISIPSHIDCTQRTQTVLCFENKGRRDKAFKLIKAILEDCGESTDGIDYE